LSIAEAFLAPAMPSTTARAGGIFMPIINSLALASGSEPGVCHNCHNRHHDRCSCKLKSISGGE
jgi:di/tricarboxylate transporter